MAKDRFNTRASYDSEFKFGSFENTVKSNRTITYEQTILMKQMIKADTVNNWEKQFISNCIKYNTLSQKQKDTLNQIYIKFKTKK